MSRLFRVLERMRRRGDRAEFGRVLGLARPGEYLVELAGTAYNVPAFGDAIADDGQIVAVLVSGETGRPVGMLGAVTAL